MFNLIRIYFTLEILWKRNSVFVVFSKIMYTQYIIMHGMSTKLKPNKWVSENKTNIVK